MNHFGQPRTHLILAADRPSLGANLDLLQQVGDQIDVVKVCSPLIYSEGARAITKLARESHRPVFADLKLADVPHTDAEIVKICRDHGAAAVMVHGFLGPDALAASIEAAEGELGIITQVELTNPGGLIFNQPIADDIAQLARDTHVFGIQAPGNRPERVRKLREIIGPEKIIVCCGVGVQGGSFRDVRTAGGDYAIVGRAIYNAADPAEACRAILDDGDTAIATVSKRELTE
ncbi:MAG: orotidine-5'-phosphate decarboxylase [bacterium]|nr:orotidine-5'-phosphate decarboxylase [bacterium]